jgi:branched-chain amino acid transport system permease protein
VVVLGGLGSQIGIIIAVIFLNTVFELRQFQDYRMLIVGLSMVLIMVWRPRGLISTRHPSVLLHPRKKMPAAIPAEGHG